LTGPGEKRASPELLFRTEGDEVVDLFANFLAVGSR
jgi:hypothetical protein